jgi:hypothetical protein
MVDSCSGIRTRKLAWKLGLLLLAWWICALPVPAAAQPPADDSPYKVYVMLGFHTSFYHSWRGDTPDEAGFGTDIRVVREIIKMLDQANAEGLDARGYWDVDVYWTLQEIIPIHAPDIIEDIGRRVEAGLDEVLPGPYNNGANHAATEEEFRTAVAYALENPYGSGLKQLFGQVTPIYRPQEGMFTAGQARILLEEGIEGIVNYYTTIPFNAISTFVPALPPEQRYNPLWLRAWPQDEPIVLLPCVSPGDVVNYISLERWMRDLRQLQTSGEVESDLLLHINFDADNEAWLPASVPERARWFPNTGGLVEYIQAVNKYPWAEFTVPSEYLQSHVPQAGLLVRQDLADGAFDGNYSWAEKYASISNWSALERSRLHTYRATALAQRLSQDLAEEIDHRLWDGPKSSFFQRLVGLSTTHFGMSTPILNEERQARAEMVIGAARTTAAEAERDAAMAVREQAGVSEGALYEFEVYNYARSKSAHSKAARTIVRVPLLLPQGVERVQVVDAEDNRVQASLVNVQEFGDGTRAAELLFVCQLGPQESRRYRVDEVSAAGRLHGGLPTSLKNDWIELGLSESSGIASFEYEGQAVGGDDFLQPFITYRSGREPATWFAADFQREDLSLEDWQGLRRARTTTNVPMNTPDGHRSSEFRYTFTLFRQLPYLLVDVEAEFAYTPPQDTVHTLQQKLRRLLDLRWIEVAPSQLNLSITAPAKNPLRIWKHNYLGVTASYDLNYGLINPRNRNLDSFNHQVTAGWVAMTNGQLGLLVAENAEVWSSMAFCPMRLREVRGTQHLSLNPFGSYYGKQLDYSHLGGTGVGTEFARVASGSLKPNAPSFNGQTVRFSLLLAPYSGDQPPVQLQDDAEAFFYPFGVVYLQTPTGVDAVVPEDVRALVAAREKEAQTMSPTPLPPPTALLASPSDGAVDLTWDPPRDDRVTGYELRWREAEGGVWRTRVIGPANRLHMPNLTNDTAYLFQIRALAEDRTSTWAPVARGIPGPVSERVSPFSSVSGASPLTLLKLIYYGLVHGLTTR